MRGDYRYLLAEPLVTNFDAELTPKQMLSLGAFGGKYIKDG